MTGEEKREIVARALRTPQGHIRLSDAVLGRPQAPAWKVWLRAIPVWIRWVLRDTKTWLLLRLYGTRGHGGLP